MYEECLSTRGTWVGEDSSTPGEGTSLLKVTPWAADLSVAGDGVGVVSHAGSSALRLLAYGPA